MRQAVEVSDESPVRWAPDFGRRRPPSVHYASSISTMLGQISRLQNNLQAGVLAMGCFPQRIGSIARVSPRSVRQVSTGI